MPVEDSLFQAALSKYSKRQNPQELDQDASFLSGSFVHLVCKSDFSVVASYEIDELKSLQNDIRKKEELKTHPAINKTVNEHKPETEENPNAVELGSKDNRINLCYTACILLLFGCFTPLISVPTNARTFNYFDYNRISLFTLAISMSAFIFATQRKYHVIRKLGLASTCMISMTFWHFQIIKSNVIKDLVRDLSGEKDLDPIGSSHFRLIMQSQILEWAWFLLIAGSLLLLAVPKMNYTEGKLSINLDDILPTGENKLKSILVQVAVCTFAAFPIALLFVLFSEMQSAQSS